jgi:hypothetical protein
VTVESPNCKAGDDEMNNATLISPDGSGVTVREQDNHYSCLLTARLSIDSEAPISLLHMWVKKSIGGKDAVIGIVTFEVAGILPGPIPPGLTPQVDVMWSVMTGKHRKSQSEFRFGREHLQRSVRKGGGPFSGYAHSPAQPPGYPNAS